MLDLVTLTNTTRNVPRSSAAARALVGALSVTKVVCVGDTDGQDVCETAADCSKCTISLGCVTLSK